MPDEPGDQRRRGWLKNGNPPGDFRSSPRCGAKNRAGLPCREPALKGRTRCRLHGGWSHGPTSAAGLARSKTARLSHGYYSQEAAIERDEVKRSIALVKNAIAEYHFVMAESEQREDQRSEEYKERLWSLYTTLTAKVREKLSASIESDPEAKTRHALQTACWAKLARVLDELATVALQ